MIIVSERLRGKLPENFDWFYMPTSPFLPREVAFHTDLRIFSFNDELICAPSVYEIICRAVDIPVLCGEKEPSGKYPDDVPYNAIAVGRFLICNPETADKTIIRESEKRGLKVIGVRQGYARCSAAVVCGTPGDEAIITSDNGIAKAAKAYGIEVLKIKSGGIKLEGFEYGFIGGATVTIPDELLFFGNPESHPSGKEIVEFCRKYGIKVTALTDGYLTDFGSGICV